MVKFQYLINQLLLNILSVTYSTNFDTFLLQPEKPSVTQIQMMVEDSAQGQGDKPHSCLCQKYWYVLYTVQGQVCCAKLFSNRVAINSMQYCVRNKIELNILCLPVINKKEAIPSNVNVLDAIKFYFSICFNCWRVCCDRLMLPGAAL